MQQTHIFPDLMRSRGGRLSSPKLRDTLEQSNDFTGLEEGINRYDLLLLVKRVGKLAGFTPRMISLLDYYMAFTRDMDWEEGSRPVVYKSIASTALDMGVSERQIQALEKQLFEVGAITWNDSGNHRRYGQRCEETGQILYAFGVDLTPLAYLRAELQNKLNEKQLRDKAWMQTKRQVSYYRRQIRSILQEAQDVLERNRAGEVLPVILDDADILNFTRRYDANAGAIRTYMALDTLRSLLDEHKTLYEALYQKISAKNDQVETTSKKEELSQKDSSRDDSNNVHYKYTYNNKIFKKITCRDKAQSFQKSVAESPQQNSDVSESGNDASEDHDVVSSTGLQHVSLKQLLNIASDRFKEHLPIEPRPMNHRDFIEAANSLKESLGISQKSWGYACLTLGRIGAAVCVILTDQATLRDENRVTKPGAYFNAMINRAKVGELKLHQSIMGHLKRDEGFDPSNNNDFNIPERKV